MFVPAYFMEAIAPNTAVGQCHYGDMGITPDLFVSYVWDITLRHAGNELNEPGLLDFANKLYLRDLYLTCGCTQGLERAWQTLDVRYRKFISNLVRYSHRSGTDNEEITDALLVSLYLPDRAGRQRIASYDGRSCLATWLRVVVIHRAINCRNEPRETGKEEFSDVADYRALASLDSLVRAKRYQNMFTDALREALQELTARERLMLLWRYEQDMQLGEIACLLGIHQSNVTRQLARLQSRLREAVVRLLGVHHNLSASAIAECFADAVDNPYFSVPVIDLIKRVPASLHWNTPPR
jgi:RNA polymerase sigma-70 factor